ncbi:MULTISPECIES: H-NS family nucleoid-associated regulatory protein [Vibrio]|uniref:H-NS family nucleoid-associated regulatory protein n=1 Tax=Vibrio TaxID=662 RepID=UPI001E3F89E0|nr:MULTISPECIES: H-NS family nucleoid-associated regulatory protein [Vibrio]MCC2525554.1 H-NS histone family protein [Vibrio coralliilyticus]USD35565.1 H-NS histone family protein [Vibrio sp. SCSIO 43186]USD72689.1 H-NS histone family protein [Vibrio sp. SCSIO 43139]USD98905.1 transcriptional regulator [Vibrio coralliilyticus]
MESITKLMSRRNLRAAIKKDSVTHEQLEKFINLLMEEAEPLKKAEEEARAKKEEQDRLIDEMIKKIHDADISTRDFVSRLELGQTAGRKNKRTVQPKYKYTDGGVEKTWTGQGRTPAAMEEQMSSSGKTLDDFLITS